MAVNCFQQVIDYWSSWNFFDHWMKLNCFSEFLNVFLNFLCKLVQILLNILVTFNRLDFSEYFMIIDNFSFSIFNYEVLLKLFLLLLNSCFCFYCFHFISLILKKTQSVSLIIILSADFVTMILLMQNFIFYVAW